MLEPTANYFIPIGQKVAVHIDDVPQTVAEQTVAEEIPANVEVELYDPDELTLGYYLTESELTLAKSHMFGGGDSGFILFGQVAIPKQEIRRVIFYPENN